MYIFGYGSLVNIKSAQKSFKRILKPEDFITVKLNGYQKVWNSIESIIFENESVVSKGIFLNLEENESACTPGVLVKITTEEFEFLKLREKNYSCIEIDNHQIQGLKTDEPIITFKTSKEDKIAQNNDLGCYIPQGYINLLLDELYIYDKAFQEEFLDSIKPYAFTVKEGSYKFSDPIQNKFAKDGLMNEK